MFRRRSRFTQRVWSVRRDFLLLLLVPKGTPEIQTIIFLIYDGNEQCWYGGPVYCPLLVLVGNISLNTHYRLSFNPWMFQPQHWQKSVYVETEAQIWNMPHSVASQYAHSYGQCNMFSDVLSLMLFSWWKYASASEYLIDREQLSDQKLFTVWSN